MPAATELELDARKDTVEAAFAAAYQLLDRAFVRLRRGPRNRILVRLRARPGRGRVPLASVFLTELEEQRRRVALARNNTRQLEAIVGRALFAAAAPSGGDAAVGEAPR